MAIFDVSDPYSPSIVSYSNTRNFGQSPGQDATTKAISGGDPGPEGLVSVAAANSPTGLPMVMVANEVSGTVGLFNVVPMSSSENDPYLWLGSNLSNASLAPGSLFIA